MKWFSYIFRHGFIIVLVCAISITYVYRQQLFPAFFEKKLSSDLTTEDKTEDTASGESDELASALPIQKNQSSVDFAPDLEKGVEQEAVDDSRDSLSVEDTETQASVSQNDMSGHKDSKLAQAPSINEPLTSTDNSQEEISSVTTSDAHKDIKTPEVDNKAEQNDTMAVIDSNNTQEQQYFQIISKARQAFWQNKYKESVTLYEQAILHLPSRVDAYGELGNVYYAMGEWSRAGENLYLAALRLIESGQLEQARYLSTVIKGLKPERAKELDKKLATE